VVDKVIIENRDLSRFLDSFGRCRGDLVATQCRVVGERRKRNDIGYCWITTPSVRYPVMDSDLFFSPFGLPDLLSLFRRSFFVALRTFLAPLVFFSFFSLSRGIILSPL
jgi:hypothetical protein